MRDMASKRKGTKRGMPPRSNKGGLLRGKERAAQVKMMNSKMPSMAKASPPTSEMRTHHKGMSIVTPGSAVYPKSGVR